jgi:hypothetical protein
MDNSLSVRGMRSVVLRVAIGDFIHMTERTVFFLSDQTGVTAETLGHSLLTQFDSQQFRQITLPFIDSDDKANDALARINAAAEKDDVHPIVFSTLVQDDFRAIVRQAEGLYLDIFDVFLSPLEEELQQESTHEAGRAHGMSDIESYMNRIEATHFALANDDGGMTRNYEMADVILIGVSRSGKTPTCLYMALQYGVYAANFPLTDEEFDSGTLPDFLINLKQKIVGLTIAPTRLQQMRKERRALGQYSSMQQVRYELREAEKIFKKCGVPVIDTTEFSIEEISSRILNRAGVERRVRS